MSHPTEPLLMVHGHTGPQALLIVDDEGNAVDVSAATGDELEFAIRDSTLDGEVDLVRLEQADGIAHVTGETGKINITISSARWAALSPNRDYVAQVHYEVPPIDYWSHPFLLRLVQSFTA